MSGVDRRGAVAPALVFSIAMNGYRWAWRACLRTHRAYVARLGFDYACVDLPWAVSAAEAAWLKIALAIRVLERGVHPWLLFVDADARFRPGCPDFRSVATAAHDVYMAHGHSGRFNSGVIVARATPASLAFFRAVLADCETAVTGEDAAPYENGHVIRHGKANPLVGRLDRRWNNTADPDLDDYVRHYTGPMAARAVGDRKAWLRRFQRAGAWRSRVAGLWTAPLPDGSLPERLGRLTDAAGARYAPFARR